MPAHSRKTILLAPDQQRSVLNALHAGGPHPLVYTPYGHRPIGSGLISLLGFNGELPDTLTGHYHLGNGYRAFSPVLMRFICPDSWSPFGKGGLNAYVYCDGDPRNKLDPSGHTPAWLKTFLRSRGLMRQSTQKAIAADTGTSRLPQPAQINTQKNVLTSSLEEGKPKEIGEIQTRLELRRQDHAFNLEHYPNTTTTYGRPSYVQINGKNIPSRRAYSKLAVEHHNKNNSPTPAELPPTIRFADSPVVHDVERLVEMPPGGWRKVADTKKIRS